MPLKLYNTLSRQKEEFVPIQPDRVGMYVCGPTVYGDAHIGHAKSYVSFDVIVRYLRHAGYRVIYVQNITDVGHLTDDADEGEDKILKKSKADQVHPMQIVETYTKNYFDDMDALNVLRPDISPRATGHIIEQIEIVEELLRKGVAYESGGSVYFDVRSFAEYGKLSGRKLDDMIEGTRVESRGEKRHPGDFALWKKAEAGHIMRWKSPWGEGFPGWHLECSAMSMKYLGETFDIHGGGMDNQFPHHECEIAQSVSATGKPFVKYWLHNNLVTVNGQKMGKSLGNFVTLKDAYKKFDPIVIRFFILQSHYRSTLDYGDDAVEAAGKGLEKLQGTFKRLTDEKKKNKDGALALVGLEEYRRRFFDAMNDDFNTSQAIGVLFDFVRDVNDVMMKPEGMKKESIADAEKFFLEAGGDVLGIISGRQQGRGESLEPQLLDLIIELRKDIRIQKLWQLSDKIRDALKNTGIVLEDSKDGTTWRKIL
jgi:cysteinyl-tRNA synthetase